MTITSESEMMSAKAVGTSVLEFEKVLRSIAKDIGGKVNVFLSSMEVKPKEVKIGMTVVSVVAKSPSPTAKE